MRVNRTYPTIVGWTAELAKKRIREENKSKAFVRRKVIPRIAKPAAVAVATYRQNVEAPISAEPTVNVPPSSVDRVAEIFFPVLCHGHYFLVCINIKASKVEIIDNKALITGVTKKDKYGDYTNLLVTSLREYQAVGSSELFWKEDGLTEEVVNMH
nr:uncharacterized protein LOC109146741 [Ipomoea batatas]